MMNHSERRKDLRYIVSARYALMKRRANTKQMEICNRDEFRNFALSSEVLKQLHEQWIASGFDTKKSPSVDRIDNTKGYYIDNIQFITHSENVYKGNIETGRKPPVGMRKRAVTIEKDGDTFFFETGKEACDFLGLPRNALCIAIRDGKSSHGWSASYT